MESAGSSLTVGTREDSGSDLNSTEKRKKKKHKKEKSRDKVVESLLTCFTPMES